MRKTGKIIGFPLKILCNSRIFIPFEYLRFYGISEKHDKLLLEISKCSLFYRPLCDNSKKCEQNKIRSIRAGLTMLPIAWVRKNNLKIGDFVFLLGTDDGILIYYNKPKITGSR